MEPLLPSFETVDVLVCGDVMLDRTLTGEVSRVSPEAPVPVLTVGETLEAPGGAANVARNVAALGASCTLLGLVGDDPAAERLEALLSAAGVQARLLRVPGWSTPIKVRASARQQQLLRLDYEADLPAATGAEARAALAVALGELAAGHAVTVFADYAKGALADAPDLVMRARAAGARVVVDPKTPPLERWQGADVIKPNAREFEAAAGEALAPARFAGQASTLLARARAGALLVTRGADGMLLAEDRARSGDETPPRAERVDIWTLPARRADVYDVTGAGDTAAAILAAAFAADAPLLDAARWANVGASLAVARAGTAVVASGELRAAGRDGAARGVLAPAELARAATSARARGERIVLANGCFDLLHAGHVGHLEAARRYGDRLVVAVNDDASTQRLKGAGRPVTRLAQRMTVLAGLAAVDWVTWFGEDTPEALIDWLRPDVLVKGGDYAPEAVIGAEQVRAYGGQVAVTAEAPGCSTTALVQTLVRGPDAGASVMPARSQTLGAEQAGRENDDSQSSG